MLVKKMIVPCGMMIPPSKLRRMWLPAPVVTASNPPTPQICLSAWDTEVTADAPAGTDGAAPVVYVVTPVGTSPATEVTFTYAE